jgi:Protein of unknown function (DUF3237)
MLVMWGFTPKILGYVPNVRGVVTGLADPRPQYSYGGLAEPSMPLRQFVTAPPLGSNRVRRVTMSTEPRREADSVPLLRASAPGAPGGVVGQLPVLRLIVEELSSRFGTSVKTPRSDDAPRSGAAGSSQPRWAWDATFLGSLTAMLRKELVGVTPDGLRINWHVKTGTFVGPGLDAIVLAGAADWMRIRPDGVAIVNVQACFETREGILVYGAYGGVFDLGPDGYARALRDEYDDLPPVVVTPTYATADPRLGWLNRAQCVGVGRVDMNALRVEFDVYAVRVGGAMRRAAETGRGGRARCRRIPCIRGSAGTR